MTPSDKRRWDRMDRASDPDRESIAPLVAASLGTAFTIIAAVVFLTDQIMGAI